MEVIDFIRDITIKVIAIAWMLFFLTWVIGWALRGSPIPFLRVKRTGQGLIEDSIWAAFWLAMGSTVFGLVAYIVSTIGLPFPAPPTP